MRRVRTGIILIVVSWLPFAQLFLWIAHNNGKLSSHDASDKFRLAVWGIQFLIGFVGLWLVGKSAIAIAKEAGWKNMPKRMWHLFRYGEPTA